MEAFIQSLTTSSLTLTLAFDFCGRAMSQDPAAHRTGVRLHEFQQGQWVEKILGDFSKRGAVRPVSPSGRGIYRLSVHPSDRREPHHRKRHMGTWYGTALRSVCATLMELGSFGIEPKNMARVFPFVGVT